MAMNNSLVVTVSQLNRKIALMLGNEHTFSNLSVRGEISNLTIHQKSGHIYFSIKDEASSLKAVMFCSNAQNLSFVPENGMSVIARGAIRCYERDGVYQIVVSSLTEQGNGDMSAALERLKERLKNEGVFSQKRPLPQFPEKICVITSESGAAIKDILNILSRRYPIADVVILPVLVQGEFAADSIEKAFALSGKTGADLIIFGRGGGSKEDLSAFNEEKVVRAIFNSSIPTISAVGHETDTTLSDYAADLRAATPSEAAELAVPDISSLMETFYGALEYIKRRTSEIIEYNELSLKLLSSEINLKSPIRKLESREQSLLSISENIQGKFSNIVSEKEHKLYEKASVISALNPLAVLTRGYSIIYKNDVSISSLKQLNSGDEITIKLSDGEKKAIIK